MKLFLADLVITGTATLGTCAILAIICVSIWGHNALLFCGLLAIIVAACLAVEILTREE